MLIILTSIVVVAVVLLPAIAELIRVVDDRRRGETLLGLRRRRAKQYSLTPSASGSFC